MGDCMDLIAGNIDWSNPKKTEQKLTKLQYRNSEIWLKFLPHKIILKIFELVSSPHFWTRFFTPIECIFGNKPWQPLIFFQAVSSPSSKQYCKLANHRPFLKMDVDPKHSYRCLCLKNTHMGQKEQMKQLVVSILRAGLLLIKFPLTKSSWTRLMVNFYTFRGSLDIGLTPKKF